MLCSFEINSSAVDESGFEIKIIEKYIDFDKKCQKLWNFCTVTFLNF